VLAFSWSASWPTCRSLTREIVPTEITTYAHLGVNDVSEYESQAIAVVTMQNKITSRWNQTVDEFNATDVILQSDHIVLFSTSLDSARGLITDSQAVINRWNEIEASDKHVNSYELGLEALMATQDGLILIEEYFQSSIDTRIAGQLQAGEASDKLLYAAELWRAAADMAALEG
jgi:hypothetical protein